ncbi:hypothetical protein ACOQFL_16020 [Actinopolyspora sp. H202]
MGKPADAQRAVIEKSKSLSSRRPGSWNVGAGVKTSSCLVTGTSGRQRYGRGADCR